MPQNLLPIRAITIRLRFLKPSYAPYFHHPQLKPFLKELLQDKAAIDNENGLWVEAIESGRTVYKQYDEYRFNLFCTAPAYALFIKLLDRIRRLPHSYPGRIKQHTLFADNMEFIGLQDYFTTQAITHQNELFSYDQQALQREIDFWQTHDSLTLRFTSPTRFKVIQQQKGKPPYIRDRGQIHIGETERRIYKALCNLSPTIKDHCHTHDISYQQAKDRLFWTDNAKTLRSNNKVAPFGGVMGEITLSQPVANNVENKHLPLLILGQYTGIGERRSYGLGRYRLETAQGKGTIPPRQRAENHHQRATAINTLELACYNIARKHPYIRQYIDHTLEEFNPEIEDKLENRTALNSINLHALSRLLTDGDYQASILQGVILRQKNKHPRPLAVPPLEDRIAQRAVVEIMGVDIDQLSTIHSYGYRKGMSRQQARDEILMLNRQGYEWFFEADIEEFFDLISFQEIENRLLSFFPDEPLIALIMEWIKAPVQFDGEIIQRKAGLPQGSPISPMLANLMLEDFDTDLEAAGMKLIRFADDFVILGKDKQQAQQAASRAEQSLQELGLVFNPKKTHIGHFSESFKFLGYTFLSGMALESTHRTLRSHPDKLKLDNIPTASWLAKLLDQHPQKLKELNRTLDKKHRKNDPSHIITTPQPNNTQQNLPSSELGSTLFITQPRKNLQQKNGMLEITDGESKSHISRQNWNDLSNIVLIGRHNMTQYCQLSALNNNIPIHHCSATGKYLGITTNKQPSQEGAELWLQQSQAYQSTSTQALQLIRTLVDTRIHNQIEVLRQRLRHHTDHSNTETSKAPLETQMRDPLKAIQRQKEDLQTAATVEQIRGYEGQAAALYFAQLSRWIPAEFNFKKRQKRPPRDPFNALLSLGYTVLYSHTSSILQIAGLYPWHGFYHQGYGRHQALASDLMEAYRHIIERTAMTLLRSAQLKPKDFYYLDNGACQLTREALKIYLTQISSRLLKPIMDKQHPVAMSIHEHQLRNAHQLIRNIRDADSPVDFFKLK